MYKIKKLIIGFLISLFLINIVIADSSTNYTVDVSELNGTGELLTSSSYQLNDTFVGFVDGLFGYSTNYILGSGLVYLEQLCGNSILEFGETCDDGNLTNGDGCSSTCLLENVCGNGVVEAGEGCDDGNVAGGDGCSFICTVETGWNCAGTPSTCSPICGDGLIVGSEACDDGNTASGDGCSSTCQIEILSVCGNGILESGEQCDDGNTNSNDGCSAACILETGGGGGGYVICGNGIREGSEQCDDGNNENGDGCNSICLKEGVKERTFTVKARPEKRVNPTQNWGTTATLAFLSKETGAVTFNTQIPINDTGWGTLTTNQIPDGIYDISLKGLSHLTKVMRNVEINSNTHTLDFTFGETFYLLAGDVHESKDDFINALDITATVKALYTDNIHADLNKDGLVNALDITITVNNLYRNGESF
ncbi:DUF4215 domain-containing protein [Candidatus Peregrinibacteria bacterium]|nr:DUF4215 domain-containing protein [Candidatus Peregrinibacteria bacterium]